MDPLEYHSQKLEELYGLIRERQANIYNRNEVRHMPFQILACRLLHVMLYPIQCNTHLLMLTIMSCVFTIIRLCFDARRLIRLSLEDLISLLTRVFSTPLFCAADLYGLDRNYQRHLFRSKHGGNLL